MKDLIIKASVLKKELKLWIILLIGAFFVNVYAIIVHSGGWVEMITQLHVVIILSLVLYLLTVIFRLIKYISRRMLKVISSK